MVGVIWDIIKKIFGWAWDNKNVAGYIILAIIIIFLTWRNNNLKIKNTTLEVEKGKLPENIEFVMQLKGNKFTATYRDSKGAVVYKEYYVPSEGGVKFTKYIDLKQYDANAGFSGQTQTNTPSIPSLNPFNNLVHGLFGNKDKDKKDGKIEPYVDVVGFTFRPGISFIYDGGYNPSRPVTIGLDAKLIYAWRYSAGLGSTMDYPYIWTSRHIDDLVPFIPINNIELMLGYGKPYSSFSNSVFTIGGRSNF